MILGAIYKRRVLQTNTNAYVISLAISEIVMSVVCLPPIWTNYWAGSNIMSTFICKTQNFFQSMSNGIAIWHIVFMTMDHYALMAYHEHYAKYTNLQATYTQLIFTWAIPILVLISRMTTNVEHTIYQSRLLRCMFQTTSIHSTILFSVIFDMVLPSSIIITVFILFAILIKKKNNGYTISDLPTTEVIPTFTVHDVRVVKAYVVLYISIVFPYVLFLFNRTSQNHHPNVSLLVDSLAWSVMCSKPICYTALHRRFRTTFKMMLFKDLEIDLDKKCDDDDEYKHENTTKYQNYTMSRLSR